MTASSGRRDRAAGLTDRLSSFLFFRRLKENSVIRDIESSARLVAHVLSSAPDSALACAEIGQVIYLLADRQVASTRQDLLDACKPS